MKPYRLHYNRACPACRHKAALLPKLDWFGRVECSTETPADRQPVPPGEIAVHHFASGQTLRGRAALAALYRQLPLAWPVGVILSLLPANPVRAGGHV